MEIWRKYMRIREIAQLSGRDSNEKQDEMENRLVNKNKDQEE